jgi:hypothetical protein
MPDPSPNQVANPTASLSDETRALYELQKPFVEPMLRMFRLTNTALDVIFYDVGVLTQALWARGTAIDTGATAGSAASAHPLQTLDLTAATNPSGSIIVVNANAAPYVRPPFLDMGAFFAHANGPDGAGIHTLRSPVSAVRPTARWRLHGTYPQRSASPSLPSFPVTALPMSCRRHSAAGSGSSSTASCRRRRKIFSPMPPPPSR